MEKTDRQVTQSPATSVVSFLKMAPSRPHGSTDVSMQVLVPTDVRHVPDVVVIGRCVQSLSF